MKIVTLFMVLIGLFLGAYRAFIWWTDEIYFTACADGVVQSWLESKKVFDADKVVVRICSRRLPLLRAH